jgi:two-component system LytT family sensor kinase
MEAHIPVKKLFRLALLTSPVIGILAIGTISIVPYFFLKGFTILHLYLFIGLITLVIFSFWSINIGLTLWLNKTGRRTFSVPVRYVLSYVFVPIPILTIRFIAMFFLDEQAYLNQVAPNKTIYFIYIMRFCIIFSINTIILVLQDLVVMRENKAMVELENAVLRVKNVEALNQQLKQQIHPHFLFNSLNTLKALIKRNPERAGDYLIRLSDYLRTSISIGQVNSVSLREELKLSTDYLEMQKMRFGEALQFQIDLPEVLMDAGFVPVLALQVLIENAIKHNALTTELPLTIKISYTTDWLTVSNTIQPKQTTESSLGFGLANLNERYRILSGDETRIRASNEEFAVSIKVLPQTDTR